MENEKKEGKLKKFISEGTTIDVKVNVTNIDIAKEKTKELNNLLKETIKLMETIGIKTNQ